jgi:hypothetical protein
VAAKQAIVSIWDKTPKRPYGLKNALELELDRLGFLDNKGQKYGWSSSSSSSSESTSPVCLGTPPTANNTPQVTPNHSNLTSSSPTATHPKQKNQYDKLSSDIVSARWRLFCS